MSNIVAIVGRPNVGKSTFFNRMIEQRQSIIDDQSGVTRDRIYGQAQWTGHFFTLVDTGGYVVGSDDTFEDAIRNQVRIAMEEADVVLFMVDCTTGLMDLDKDFANIVRQYNKPVIIVANKADHYEAQQSAVEFYALGLGDKLFPIAAQSGSGTGDLLDEIVSLLPSPDEIPQTLELPHIAVVGRPNVGKSSFVNLLLGEERSIVTNIAGTTRDSVHAVYKAFGQEFVLVDTAGIRRKSKVHEDVEFYSVMRSLRALESTDVCIIMIDAERGIASQDVNLIGLADRNKKGIVLMVNKWDLIEKDHRTADEFKKEIYERIAPMTYVPILFTSVLNKQRVFQSIQKAMEVYEARSQRIPTSALNDALLPEIERYPPPATKGKYIRIKYVTQLPTATPAFAFFCNLPQYIKEPYARYLENQIRKHFDFEGVPIQVFFRKK